MKMYWMIIAALSASLVMAQDAPPPPPSGQQPQAAQPPPPPDGQPLPPPPPGHAMPNRPPDQAGRPDNQRWHRPGAPMREPQNFEDMLQRQLGPQLEQLKEFSSVLKDRLEMARRMFESRQVEQAMTAIRDLGFQLRDLRDLKERDPERYKLQQRIGELDRRSGELGQKIRRESDESARKASSEELKTLLTELFDLRQQEREKNVQQIDRELKNLREQLDKRKARRDEIIQHRFNQLTGKAELMEW